MFTTILIAIIIVVFCAYMSKKPDKKSAKKQAEDAQKLAQLPDINIISHELTSAQKALNLFPSDKDVLHILRYNSTSQNIYLQMRDGRSISCPLNQLDVAFDHINDLYKVICTYGNMKFSFYEYAYVFTDQEWETLYSVIALAGTTHNVDSISKSSRFFSKVNRNIQRANSFNRMYRKF